MNKSEIIDISIPLSKKLPVWPNGFGINISSLATIGNNSDANVSRLDIDVHSGTHIDAPLHFIENGKTTNEINLDRLIGDCFLVELPKNLLTIQRTDLENLNIPNNTTRLLLKTYNSFNNLWDNQTFDKEFCAISADAAEWLVEQKIDLIGIDYCSIQKFYDPPVTHQIILNNNIIILEGLDLRNVGGGMYKLTCLPISILGIEGVPVRAILKKI